jgi:hypothetical protein
MQAIPALCLALVLAAVAGCATEAPKAVPVQVASAAPAPAAASAPRQVCNREIATGTSFAKTVCHDIDEHGNAEGVADAMDQLQRQQGMSQGMLSRGGANH